MGVRGWLSHSQAKPTRVQRHYPARTNQPRPYPFLAHADLDFVNPSNVELELCPIRLAEVGHSVNHQEIPGWCRQRCPAMGPWTNRKCRAMPAIRHRRWARAGCLEASRPQSQYQRFAIEVPQRGKRAALERSSGCDRDFAKRATVLVCITRNSSDQARSSSRKK
jgi:hypothetical protein